MNHTYFSHVTSSLFSLKYKFKDSSNDKQICLWSSLFMGRHSNDSTDDGNVWSPQFKQSSYHAWNYNKKINGQIITNHAWIITKKWMVKL